MTKYTRLFLILSVIWTSLNGVQKTFADKLGKNDARPGQFPYQALIIQVGFCGGTLISARFVLTAAHCVPKKTTVHVHLGCFQFDQLDEEGRLMFKTTAVRRHEKFNPQTLQHDLALIKLPKNVRYTETIQPARLPWSINSTLVGQRVVVTGWGKTSDRGDMSSKLQMETVVVISNEVCSQFYEQNVFSTDLCTIGTEKESVCDGDSGGPLVIEGSTVLVGVVSYYHGSSCESGYPSGYMRLTHYRNWISNNMRTM